MLFRRAPIAMRTPISLVRSGYGHQHDVHHADAADHQRNQGDGRKSAASWCRVVLSTICFMLSLLFMKSLPYHAAF